MNCYGHIYIITCLLTGKQYVGQTISDLEKRWSNHKGYAKNNRYTHALAEAMRQYGVENFEFIHFADCFSRAALDALEIKLIAEYNTIIPNGYNMMGGGNGHEQHPSTRAKISKANSGKPKSAESVTKMAIAKRKENLSVKTLEKMRKSKLKENLSETTLKKMRDARLGKKSSQEVRDKISKSLIGRKNSPESIEKTASFHRGRKRSQETKDLISLAATGRQNSPEAIEKTAAAHRKSIIDNYGTVYASIVEAALIIGCHKSGISAVLRGKQKTCFGFEFYWYCPPD